VQTPATTSRASQFFQSSLGQKLAMAATGVVLSGFVLGHMAGNLTAFNGAAALDAYGAALRRFPALLWGVRLGLLASVVLHIWAYWMLSQKSWGARPQGYRVNTYQESSWASRTMRWTGPFLAVFIVYHLLHLTTGNVHPDFQEGRVYHNLISGLKVLPVAIFYVAATGALGFHLWHGVWSLFQSIGISQPRYDSFGRRLATLFTIVVVGGFAIIPLAVLAGILR
jgi:succinate dehydrogenase / fumarate reductase cytochrome b subunit